jgi:hypothetical protein
MLHYGVLVGSEDPNFENGKQTLLLVNELVDFAVENL